MPLRIFRQAAVLAVFVLAAGLLGPLLTPGWPASAPPDLALSWLRAGATAPRRVSYAGTKAITLWGGRVETSQVRIYHEAPNATRLEYLAAGVPTVYPALGDLPDMVGDAGLAYRPGDVGALNEALGSLVGDAELRSRLAGQARLRGRRWTWDSAAARIEILLADAGAKVRT